MTYFSNHGTRGSPMNYVKSDPNARRSHTLAYSGRVRLQSVIFRVGRSVGLVPPRRLRAWTDHRLLSRNNCLQHGECLV
jgi:hypothetical protein